MPQILAIRFVRIIPLLIVLGIVSALVFAIFALRYSKPKAKELIIIMFTWINSIGAGLFALASLYAWFEQNALAFDLLACFCITFLIGLAITFICKAVFLKHNPHYKFAKTTSAARDAWDNIKDTANKAKDTAEQIKDTADKFKDVADKVKQQVDQNAPR